MNTPKELNKEVVAILKEYAEKDRIKKKNLEQDVRRLIVRALMELYGSVKGITYSDEIIAQIMSFTNYNYSCQENGHYCENDIYVAITTVYMKHHGHNSSSLLNDILKVIDGSAVKVNFGLGLAKEAVKELQALGDFRDTYWDTITNTVNEIYSRYMQSAEYTETTTVKECIHRKGWISSVLMNGTEQYMSVAISFVNNGYSDIVEFTIRSFDTDNLQTLFSAFCKEKKCREDSVTGIYIQKVSYSIEELTLCEKVNSLMSVYDRKELAENGIALDILVYDPDPRVRRAVAKHGREKDDDILVYDSDPFVRCMLAVDGKDKYLDILIVDPDPRVRCLVASKGRYKDLVILKNDRNASVRREAEHGIAKEQLKGKRRE